MDRTLWKASTLDTPYGAEGFYKASVRRKGSFVRAPGVILEKFVDDNI